ncbi:MAG: hypothetical protein JXQ74_00340 [Alphaproteobacteria bacterium]|nr:hypothetical protein [Alphaproteobacteria bacterium]
MQCGKHTKIADLAIIKQPDHLIMGDYSEIREFTVITAKTTLGKHCGIERNVTISGSKYHFKLGDYSAIAHGARILLQSNDYVHDLISHDSSIEGDVTFDRYTGCGANAIVMPNNHIPEGTVIGALSFVPPNFKFEPWSVYAGIPIRKIKDRDKGSVLAQVMKIESGEQ